MDKKITGYTCSKCVEYFDFDDVSLDSNTILCPICNITILTPVEDDSFNDVIVK